MKIRAKTEKGRRGRKVSLGGSRINFFPGEALRARMEALEEERKKLKLPYAMTMSYLLRKGGEEFCSHVEALFQKAKNGDLHAKKRVGQLGQKLKKHETE